MLHDVLNGEMTAYGDGLQEKLDSVENHVHNIVEDVVNAVTKGTPLAVDGREGRRTVALLEAVYQSAREGKPLTFKVMKGDDMASTTQLAPETVGPGWTDNAN